MEGIPDRDLIIAAVQLGSRLARREAVASLLRGYKLTLTPEMGIKLDGYQLGLFLSGYEPFEPITDLKVDADIHRKLLAMNPQILIVAQLVELTAEDLMERYELTEDEVEAVKKAFAYAGWRLRPSSASSS